MLVDTKMPDGVYLGADILNTNHPHSQLLPWVVVSDDGVVWDVHVSGGKCHRVRPDAKVTVKSTLTKAKPEVSADGYEQLSYADLKRAAKAKGLKSSGTKSALVSRIREHDASA